MSYITTLAPTARWIYGNLTAGARTDTVEYIFIMTGVQKLLGVRRARTLAALEVRQYIVDNVRMWMRDCHLRRLRVDSTIYIRNVKGRNNDPGK
jgi:hypothetical protein